MVLPAPGKTPTPTPGPRPSAPTGITPTEQNAANRAKNEANSNLDNGNGTFYKNKREAQAAAAGGPPPNGGRGVYVPPIPYGALTNGPLNPRAETQFKYGQDAFGLRRGAIIRTQASAADQGSRVNPKERYVFRFLYNPETISLSSSNAPGLTTPDARNAEDTTAPLYVGTENLSFSLLLDRTQDAYEQGIRTLGTQPDIDILYKVVNGPPGQQLGFLTLSAVEIQWGPAGKGIAARPLPPFPCYITGIDITHLQFTPRMCPIRSTVSINATRLINNKLGAGWVTDAAEPAK